MKLAIKKNDTIEVIKGKEKGKRGKVISVNPGTRKVLVEKLNVLKRHVRPSQKYRQGGVIEKESPLAISNIMLVCEKCGKAVKTARIVVEEGRHVRKCKKCGEVIEN